jgi:hypothetical protein
MNERTLEPTTLTIKVLSRNGETGYAVGDKIVRTDYAGRPGTFRIETIDWQYEPGPDEPGCARIFAVEIT